MVRLNRAAATSTEKLVVFQMSALNSYLKISLNQLKAAAEITDIASLQDFCQRQTGIAETVRQKLLSDTRPISGIARWFAAEMDDLAITVLDDLLPKAA
ncbi:MAG: phasin family protein [Candidatus Competibacteraceae bacterium]|nr:phasin family protein [Candidatus Competibacteraceae bacterium]